MDENKKLIIINTVISAGIGAVVGMVELLLPHFTADSFKVILVNMLIGIVIGTTIRQFSIYTWHSKNLSQMLFSAAAIMGAIMFVIKILHYFIFGPPFFDMSLLVIVLVVEFLGLSWTYASYRYYDSMNCKLDMKKKEFIKAQQAGHADIEN